MPKSKKLYKIIYRIGFEYKGFRFLGELLKDNETYDFVWFIYPYENDFFNIIVFSDRVMQSPYWQRNIYDISIPNENLRKLFYNTFRESNIFYSDDLTGTDFKSVIDFQIKK